MTDNTTTTPKNPHCDRSAPGTEGLPHYVERLQLATNAANALAHLLRTDGAILEKATVHSDSDETEVPFDYYTRSGLHDAMVVVASEIAAGVECLIENWGSEYEIHTRRRVAERGAK